MQYFMKKEDKSLIDVEHVKTTYFDNCAFFAALASFCYSFVSSILVLLLSYSRCDYICYPTNTWVIMVKKMRLHSHNSSTFIYHTNVFEADNIYKNPPEMSFHLDLFWQFLFRSVSPPTTLLTAVGLTVLPEPRLLATASNVALLMHGRVA